MPIQLSCANCRKPLKVKDELAGRKIACPGCKTVLRVPATVGAVAEGEKKFGTDELEALAVQAIAEQIAAEAPPETKYLDFTCPQCDEQVKVDVELAGKQAPCPSCKRIVKIPQLKKTGPVDWRGTTKVPGPTKELLKNQEVLDDSWSSAAASKVSGEALLKAGAVKIPRRKVTPLEWARRGAIAFTVLLVVGALYWFGSRFLRGNVENGLRDSVEKYASGQQMRGLPPEAQVDLQRLLAEYYLAAAKKPNAPDRDGKKQLLAARQTLKGLPDVERYRGAAELVGTLNRVWPDAATLPMEVGEVLVVAPAGAPRWKLFRHWLRERLTAAGEDQAAQNKVKEDALGVIARAMPSLPGGGATSRDFTDEVGAMGVLGQEFIRGKRRDVAVALAKQAEGKAKLLTKQPLPFLVLRAMLEQDLPKDTAPLTVQSARVLSAAYLGRRAQMQEQLQKLKEITALAPEEAELRLELAELFAADAKDVAQQQVPKVVEIIKDRNYADSLWLRWELCRQVLDLEGPEAADKLAAQLLKDQHLDRLHYLILETKAAANPNGVAAAAIADAKIGGAASGLAHFLVARHQAKGDPKATASWAHGLPREPDVPFAELGVVFGILDKK